MNKLLDFVDRLCIDENLYWRVPRIGTDKPVEEAVAEVAWDRRERPNPWRLRLPGGEWISVSTSDLTATMTMHSLDHAAFERAVGVSILTQAVFADLVLEGAKDLFGAEAVAKSIRDTQAFLSSVSETAARMAKVAPTRVPAKLRLV